MYNLEQIIKLIFRRIPAHAVLSGQVEAGRLREKEFVMVAFAYLKHYSEPELSGLWKNYRDRMDDDRTYHDRPKVPYPDGIDVFDALFYYADHMLVVQDNQILCKYEKLLNWRKITFSLSEDLFTCAYFARNFTPEMMQERGFLWNVVVGHNNIPLQRILDKGISENHFHLYGSAPMFHISWISLMNNVISSRALDTLKSYDMDRRSANVRYNASYVEESLPVQVYQAALIRAYLFLNLTHASEIISFDQSQRKILLCFEQTEVKDMLSDVKCLYARLPDIQNMVNGLREFSLHEGVFARSLDDYALYAIKYHVESEESANEIFAGERWFIYMCLHEIYYYRMSPFLKKLFYAYVILKENIRAEMVQCNDSVGFANFQKYERRKKQLCEDAIFRKSAVRTAVHDNLISSHLESLEIRISPGDSATDNYDTIRQLDRIIGEPRERYFYTLHFIKESERDIKEDYGLTYRHYALRGKIRRQARALVRFRERYPRTACRVLGIDAASNEIGCRPEVFAPEFRYLRNHVKMIVEDQIQKQVPQLRVTYRVGEDFLDVVDGLRAIDEAVVFLNMDCGDRLGHALALGIDVKEWYHGKNDRILIPQQDLLDNIAWLYNRIVEYHIPETDDLKDYLVREYERLFDKVYGKNIDFGLMDQILKEARKDFQIRDIANAFYNDRYDFDIFQYYNAWKLRGDDPRLYVAGYCGRENLDISECRYMLNDKFPKDQSTRYRPEIFLLYYFYHFDSKVKEEGNKRIEVYITPQMMDGIAKVQKKMQYAIARRGISIETNPSSNYQIGTFKNYGRHPITNWYNAGLVVDPEAVEKCPQISVSINTDDKGVFATSLENEYAIMARAFEDARDEKGNLVYNKTMIYEWLDRVREMGNRQSFRPAEEEYHKLLRSWKDDIMVHSEI